MVVVEDIVMIDWIKAFLLSQFLIALVFSVLLVIGFLFYIAAHYLGEGGFITLIVWTICSAIITLIYHFHKYE